MKVLLVTKRPLLERLGGPDTARITRNAAVTLNEVRAAAASHNAVFSAVRAALSGEDILSRCIDELHSDDADDCDLVVTVGGDGTVFALGWLCSTKPVISVNSDPSRSVGHSTRCTIAEFPMLLAAFKAKRHHIELIHRLDLSIDGSPPHRIINDCLFTSRHPAGVTRYTLTADGHSEAQISSGVWISTAAGSTGAIHSAGMTSLEPTGQALLFKVREPFQAQKKFHVLEGVQQPPRGLTLVATMPGIDCYLDGSYRCVELPYGGEARFSASSEPLPLVVR